MYGNEFIFFHIFIINFYRLNFFIFFILIFFEIFVNFHFLNNFLISCNIRPKLILIFLILIFYENE